MLQASIGGIMQIAYVVDELDAAVAYWSGKLGVGPFSYRRHVEYTDFEYRGSNALPDVSLAFAFTGDTQIELIELHDDTPSAFFDFKRMHGSGVQHIGALSNDIVGDTARLAARGISVIQRSRNTRGTVALLFDTEIHPGAMLELIEATPFVTESFAELKRQARNQ